MATMVTTFKARYVAGETAKVAVTAVDAVKVTATVGVKTYELTSTSGNWTVTVPTADLIGPVRWSVLVANQDGSTECAAAGQFTVCCAGRSPLRDVIDKIDEAIRTWGTNPNRSIAVGEIRIDYKSLEDLLAVRQQYLQRAEEQERGRALTGGLRIVEVNFND